MGVNRRTLEAQAAGINEVLAAHRLDARVVRGSVTPRAIHFDLKAAGEMRVETIAALAPELAQATGSRDAQLLEHEGAVRIALPRPQVQPVRLLKLAAALESVPPLTALLGVDSAGAPLLLRIPSAAVGHVLIAGQTGAGKTALARTIVTSLAMYNRESEVQVVLVDPKRRGFGALKTLPHVLGDVVSTPEEAVTCLRWVGEELARRERDPQSRPLLVVLIDELADLLQTGGKRMERLITQVAQRGRAAGVHLVACTQKPTAGLIGSEVKAAFPVRLVGAVASSEEARYASDRTDSGAENLGGRGDFLLVGGGECVRFQAAWLGRKELDAIALRLRDPSGRDADADWSALAAMMAPPASSGALQPAPTHGHAAASSNGNYSLTPRDESERRATSTAGAMWRRLLRAR
jgi:S-DNA-T family DNA segregation ATPase FtsK/SpoIIIE